MLVRTLLVLAVLCHATGVVVLLDLVPLVHKGRLLGIVAVKLEQVLQLFNLEYH